MRISDLFYEAFSALYTNKLRSGLTILGIVIGIGSVITMLSVGQGAKNSIENQIQSMGSNLVIVVPGAMRTFSPMAGARGGAQTLTLKDSQAILKEVEGVLALSPVVYKNYQVVAGKKNTRTQIVGTGASFLEIRNYQIDTGAFFTEKQVENMARVAVLGSTVKEDLFGNSVSPIGKTIKINGIIFKVIGVTKPKGGMTALEDDIVIVPVSVVQKLFSGDEYLNAIIIKGDSPGAIESIKSQVTTLLLKRHNIKSSEMADFSVVTQEDMLSMAGSVTQVMTILLTSIAAISLVVGGIGIMNMMMTSVSERTKEIGLRKAIGAKRREIGLQFLIEAVMLTFVGGLVGVLLGIVVSFGITFFTGLTTKISLFSIILALSISSVIGIIFGYWPAQKAARLDPIEALRYE